MIEDSTTDNGATDVDTDDDPVENDFVEEHVSDVDDDVDDAADDADDDADLDDYDDDYESVTAAERVLEVCLRAIVDDPDEIEIEPVGGGRRLTLHVRVASDDMGKIIGKRGRVANALRTVVKAAGSRDDLNATVEIDD